MTIENGYDYFVIVSSSSSSMDLNVETKKVTHYTSIPGKGRQMAYRTDTYQSYRTQYSHVPNTNEVGNRSAISAVIKMFQGPLPTNLPRAYNANDVMAHLGPVTE